MRSFTPVFLLLPAIFRGLALFSEIFFQIFGHTSPLWVFRSIFHASWVLVYISYLPWKRVHIIILVWVFVNHFSWRPETVGRADGVSHGCGSMMRRSWRYPGEKMVFWQFHRYVTQGSRLVKEACVCI